MSDGTKADTERRNKLLALGLGLLILLGVVLASVLSLEGDEGEGGERFDSAEVDQLLEGLPQDGLTVGDPAAKVEVTEFGDLQCPACAQFNNEVFPELQESLASGDVKLSFRNFVILGPDSEVAAEAGLAAAEQDRFWHFAELFYANQGVEQSGYAADEGFLEDIASAAGLDVEQWQQDREDNAEEYAQVIQDHIAEAGDEGFESTPSFVIEGPSGSETLSGVPAPEELQRLIDKVS
jgi:protein-disulfide isomerase